MLKVGDLVRCVATEGLLGMVVEFLEVNHGQPEGWGYTDDTYHVRICGTQQEFPFFLEQLEKVQ